MIQLIKGQVNSKLIISCTLFGKYQNTIFPKIEENIIFFYKRAKTKIVAKIFKQNLIFSKIQLTNFAPAWGWRGGGGGHTR